MNSRSHSRVSLLWLASIELSYTLPEAKCPLADAAYHIGC
ncbi:hypothetical protein RSAG8_09643, partial [Rhizoctonia solani AG-8 WAC10335]